MSKHTEEHPDLPPLLADIQGNEDAEWVWEMWRSMYESNVKLAAQNRALKEKNFLLIRRYKRLHTIFLKFRKEHNL